MSDTKLETPVNPDRRSFLKRASVRAAVAVIGSSAFGGLLKAASATSVHSETSKKTGFSEGDREILIAAEIAEALAVTTYTNIINTAPLLGNLASDDQGYLMAARNEEMSHYLLEQSATGQASPFSTFYYPPNMFADAQTTLNVLVTLEDAFIAAYLVGVRRFSTPDLRVTAARITGIRATTARWLVWLRREWPPPPAAQSRPLPGLRASPKVSIRRTTRLRANTLLGPHLASREGPHAVC